MNITQVGDQFHVSFPFDKKMVSAIKKIPGRDWDHVRRVWKIPVAQKGLLEIFYDRYSEHKRLLQPMNIGVVPPLPELRINIPLLLPMRHYQEQGTAYCLQHKRVIIGDQMGLGKTIQAIATILAAKAFPVLIVCPKTAKRKWQSEWMKFAGRRAMILDRTNKDIWWKYITTGNLDMFAQQHQCDVFITNPESLQTYFVSHINKPKGEALMVRHFVLNEQIDIIKAIVVDELHRFKDVKTISTKCMIAMSLQKEWVLGLTGTPIVNKTKDLISQLYIINRMTDFGGLRYFEERYCKTQTFLPELQFKLHTTCFFQRRKQDVLTELPNKIREKILCDISTREEYDNALHSLEKYLRDYQNKSNEEISKSLKGEIMVQIGILKGISARGKLAEVCETIDELIEQGEKVVIFVYQKRVRDLICDRYPQARTISGKDSEKEREESIYLFNNHPKVNLIVCNIKAGGVAIDLVASSNVLFVELPWHATDCEQCEDRTHRYGQLKQVFARYFLGYRTIDEEIYELIEEKRALGLSITGGQDVTEEEIIDRISNSLFNGMKM